MKAQISIDLYSKDFSITNFDSIKHDGVLVKNCQSNDRLVEVVVDDFSFTMSIKQLSEAIKRVGGIDV